MNTPDPSDPSLDPVRAAPVDDESTLEVPVLGYNVVAATEDSITFCAMLCHEANQAYCQAMNEDSVPWATAPDWQKESCINGVKHILENPNTNATPAESHENWRREKIATGWQLGPRKDVKAKMHPYLVPYDMLGPAQQAKDLIFVAIVRAFFGL